MSELKKEKLLEQLDYWKLECQTCAQHHNYDCDDGCTVQDECEQTYQQIKHAVTVFYNVLLPESKSIPKPEVTEEWIEEKAKMITALAYKMTQYEPYLEQHRLFLREAGGFIRSLVREIQGGKHA